jgi:hypothetical protein
VPEGPGVIGANPRDDVSESKGVDAMFLLANLPVEYRKYSALQINYLGNDVTPETDLEVEHGQETPEMRTGLRRRTLDQKHG